jgi:hypothetical protein
LFREGTIGLPGDEAVSDAVVAIEGMTSWRPNTTATGRSAAAPATACKKLACKIGRLTPFPRKNTVPLAKANIPPAASQTPNGLMFPPVATPVITMTPARPSAAPSSFIGESASTPDHADSKAVASGAQLTMTMTIPARAPRGVEAAAQQTDAPAIEIAGAQPDALEALVQHRGTAARQPQAGFAPLQTFVPDIVAADDGGMAIDQHQLAVVAAIEREEMAEEIAHDVERVAQAHQGPGQGMIDADVQWQVAQRFPRWYCAFQRRGARYD